ncbi:LPS translocon maturation chaperone LptM [Alteromonas gilva]|uniref:Lipoprotein n=1 Tax=Alteromonas gilva TaxID=2987522 RepID=A0ABT5KZC1_9ALTE|nr:lipoprotein [Alteromonas gilva]MDC8829616.1 lipoprotein [Alteromonas gilva]
MAKRIAIVLLLLSSVSACGYRGALYLPETPPASDSKPDENPSSEPSGDSR